jgi:hypothetical protein
VGHTGGRSDFPLRRGVVYEIEVDRARTIELPFEHS